MSVTLEDVKDYLGIDYEDEATNRRLKNLMKLADSYLGGSLGRGYPTDDSRVQELSLLVIHDFYDNNELSPKVSQNVRRITEDLHWQIRLEMRNQDDIQETNTD